MRFILPREALLKPLQQVVGVVERRQTLPVLSNLLVNVSGAEVSFTGTDLEVEMIARAVEQVRAEKATLLEELSRLEFVLDAEAAVDAGSVR